MHVWSFFKLPLILDSDSYFSSILSNTSPTGRPRWLSWMRVQLVIRRLPFRPRRVGNILSWGFDHEIFSTVILFLPDLMHFWLICAYQLNMNIINNLLLTFLLKLCSSEICKLLIFIRLLKSLCINPRKCS